MKSWPKLLCPNKTSLFTRLEHFFKAQKSSWNLLDVQASGLPNKLDIVSSLVVNLYHYFSINVLVILNCQSKISWVSSIIVRPIIRGKFFRSDVKCVSSGNFYELIFGSVIYRILSDEL